MSLQRSPRKAPARTNATANFSSKRGSSLPRWKKWRTAYRLDAVESTTTDIRAKQDDLTRRVARLEAAPRSAPGSSAPSSAPSAASSSGRPSDPFAFDPAVVRISAQATVARSALPAALEPLFPRVGVSASALPLSGPEFGRNSRLRSPTADASIVRKLLDARRSDSGWHDISVTSRAGDAIRIFVDADRSVAARRTLWHTARVGRAFDAVAPSLGAVVSKASGCVTKDWVDLVSISFDRLRRDIALSWHDDAIRAAGGDPVAIRAEYDAAVRKASAAPGASVLGPVDGPPLAAAPKG